MPDFSRVPPVGDTPWPGSLVIMDIEPGTKTGSLYVKDMI
jgi:hypothetical protein